MSTNDPQGPLPGPDRSRHDLLFQRLVRVATDLATGATTIEELGQRLRDEVEVPAPLNLARPTESPGGHDGTAHSDAHATGVHGGIVPGP